MTLLEQMHLRLQMLRLNLAVNTMLANRERIAAKYEGGSK